MKNNQPSNDQIERSLVAISNPTSGNDTFFLVLIIDTEKFTKKETKKKTHCEFR